MNLLASRRRFLESAGLTFANLLLPTGVLAAETDWSAKIRDILGPKYDTGVAGCLVVGNEVRWLGGIGLADIENRIGMTSDSVLNIGSVSKTITAAAVMQLCEAGEVDLNANIDNYLWFSVRNPAFSNIPITCRQLLTHRSSIKDGSSYGESYTCGDSTLSLSDWLEGYLRPNGHLFNAEENFYSWQPGTINPPDEPRVYCNVGYGLLGLVVEEISGITFSDYTAENIFDPLGMRSTAWSVGEIGSGRHAVPYTLIDEALELSQDELESYLPQNDPAATVQPGDLFPHCLYSFPNYPDGLVRSSANDMSLFLMAMLNGGRTESGQVLKESTVATMLSNNHFGRALCWESTTLGGRSAPIWHHWGGDPGISAYLGFRPADQVGLFLMANTDRSTGLKKIVNTVFSQY